MFPEEPLNLSEDDGFGFFPACIGMLLNDSRYQVLRKLGRGRNSTIWLVSDSRQVYFSSAILPHPTYIHSLRLKPKYRAIKIFTAHATKAHHDGHLLELEISQSIAALNIMALDLPRLYDHFEIDGPHGRHLCLVYTPLGQAVDSFRHSAPSQSLELLKVQMIIAEVMQALVQLHDADIIHTSQRYQLH